MTLDYFHTPQRCYGYQGTTAWGATQFISAFWEENDSESQQSSIWRQRSNIASSVETVPHDWNLFVFCFGCHLLAIFCWPLEACIRRIRHAWFHLRSKPYFHVLNRLFWCWGGREERPDFKDTLPNARPSLFHRSVKVTVSKTSRWHVHPTVCPHVTPPLRLMVDHECTDLVHFSFYPSSTLLSPNRVAGVV